MMQRTGLALVSLMLLAGIGCASPAPQRDVSQVRLHHEASPSTSAPQLDTIQAQLAAPPDQVKQVVTQVLTDSGYENIVWKDGTTLTTGYREENGGLEGLYICCWGVVKSRVEATVTPGADQTTQISLHVMSEGKRTIFDGYSPVRTQYPESPENQLRLIKNKLKIVSHPYTTQSFFKLQ